ncbi:MAG: ABC transporter ATP-binding protein [Planctomycetota bacterium]|nr:MAG: ABC transporter ATP-binding protein [Planctomycetota bacterium]
MPKKRRRTLQQSLPSLRRIVTRFWPYIRKERWLLAGSLLALVAEVALRALEPWPLKVVFDWLLGGKRAGHSLTFANAEGVEPAVLLTLCALAIVVIRGLRALADYGNTVGFSLAGSRVLSQVRSEVYRHLQRLSLAFHDRARSGDLILRVMSDTAMLKDVAVTAALPLLANLLIVLSMVGVMFWLNWRLALLALTILPVFWLWTATFTRRIQQTARNQRQRESAMASTAAEAIGAMKLVQALSLEPLFAGSFFKRNQEGQKEDVRGARLTAGLERAVGFLTAVSTALVVWYGARLVLRQELTPGELLVFLTYLRNTFHPVQDFAKYTGRLAKASAAGERVIDLLEQTPAVRDLPGAVPAPAFRGAIRFENVSFAYEPDRRVLEEVEFAVDPGQHVALVGPSGIGKSTLASLLLRLYDPGQGRVLIDGRDIRDYTLASLRAQISVVLQDTLLFAATVRDNIAYGAPSATAADVEAAARLANAHDFIQALPKGYDTVLGERGVTLSGGQRQRLAIARAAVRKAPILLLDEPATGLDEENERAVLDALTRLAQERTTFFITHDLRVAAGADLVIYLERRRVLERGTHLDLLRAGGRYAALYRLQSATLNHVVEKNATATLACRLPANGVDERL